MDKLITLNKSKKYKFRINHTDLSLVGMVSDEEHGFLGVHIYIDSPVDKIILINDFLGVNDYERILIETRITEIFKDKNRIYVYCSGEETTLLEIE